MVGVYTETILSLQEKENALTIPLEAVNRNGEEATVLAVDPKNIVEERRVRVRLGLEDQKGVEVLSELSDGDRVVIGKRSGFHNGQKIQPREISAAANPGSEK
jgi:multidrug efflux pump subunit AcrA (membrane-fusion protein)